ncbi:hypothetical protein KIF24_22735 [Micromonospora sp. Llam7]|uniref:hypothetical protein n=1 Tax=Micromonospora tarapacensis TaxID=2835305 RepID=UPI001C831C69|nr:hypothetical protein [Micromonospora tarapacensis]MBX7268554.1 hypothetical protein [Micromonospora tarapacensis]
MPRHAGLGWYRAALDVARFRNGVDDTCRRAAQLDPPPERSPSIPVGGLVTAMRK